MHILSVTDLRKYYSQGMGREPVKAVEKISFSVDRGEIFGLLGPNGAGKTTIIKSVCGLIIPDEGEIRIAGFDIFRERKKALRHISAVLEGNRNLYWRLTARENLEYFTGIRGLSRHEVKGRIDWLLKFFNLSQKENTIVNKLSRGMQQKLAIAVAMACDTDLLLLDEPTLGLDVETSLEVRGLLRQIAAELGKTIIISTHDMNVVEEICDRVMIVNRGLMVAQDYVKNLMEIFQQREYLFRLGRNLTDAQQKALEELGLKMKIVPGHRGAVLRIFEMDGNAIYRVIEILKSGETPIEGLEQKSLGFEDVFLKLIRGEDDAVCEPFFSKLP